MANIILDVLNGIGGSIKEALAIVSDATFVISVLLLFSSLLQLISGEGAVGNRFLAHHYGHNQRRFRFCCRSSRILNPDPIQVGGETHRMVNSARLTAREHTKRTMKAEDSFTTSPISVSEKI